MSVDFRINNRDVLEEFISTYKSEPCLWRVKSKEYHNKMMRDSAYIKLIDVLKKIDPKADRDKVVRKINSLRTNYRKEKVKIQKSKCSGSGATEIYKTKLWYFDSFEFLGDQEDARATLSSTSNLHKTNEDDDEEVISNSGETENDVETAIIDDFDQTITTLTLTPELNTVTVTENTNQTDTSILKRRFSSARTPKKQQYVADKSDIPLKTNLKKPKLKVDRYDIFGKYVSIKLRDTKEKTQRLLAEKIINDALFMAEMNQLTLSHSINLPYSVYHSPQHPNPNVNYPQTSTVQTHNKHHTERCDVESSNDEDSKQSISSYISDYD